MKAYIFVALTITIITACFSPIRCIENDADLKLVFGNCSKKHQISKGQIESILNHMHVRGDYEVNVRLKIYYRCWLGCVMRKLETIKEGKIDWEQCKKLAKKVLTREEDKAKADKIAEICQAKVPNETKDECQLTYAAVVCMIENWKELAHQKGNIKQ